MGNSKNKGLIQPDAVTLLAQLEKNEIGEQTADLRFFEVPPGEAVRLDSPAPRGLLRPDRSREQPAQKRALQAAARLSRRRRLR